MADVNEAVRGQRYQPCRTVPGFSSWNLARSGTDGSVQSGTSCGTGSRVRPAVLPHVNLGPPGPARQLLYVTEGVCRMAARYIVPRTSVHESIHDLAQPIIETAGEAGGARTHGRRIMRSTLTSHSVASCTVHTEHRSDGTHGAGIIEHPGPQAGPRPRPLGNTSSLLCVTSLRVLSMLRQPGRAGPLREAKCTATATHLPQWPERPSRDAVYGAVAAAPHRSPQWWRIRPGTRYRRCATRPTPGPGTGSCS
jgi:hypothetical protein